LLLHSTATTINATKEIPVDDMQQENPSYDSIKSTCDDEEVQQTEHLVKGAEGVVINKINKLNTTHMTGEIPSAGLFCVEDMTGELFFAGLFCDNISWPSDLISLPVPSVEGENFGSPRLVDK
jgi:hypothetical protein